MSPSGKTRVAGVIGWPVAHSLSPRLHGYWLERHRIDGAYVPLPVRPGELGPALAGLKALGMAGANVTLPHKEEALALADEAEPLARRIGAVNTLVVRSDGSLYGRNTDALGFARNLRASAPGWQGQGRAATVLGAGGSARAVVAALIDLGCGEIRLVNRSEKRARTLAQDLGGTIRVLPWASAASALDGAALLVNATTLGMQGHPPLDLDLAPLPADAAVADLVYAPLETSLLAAARARGLAPVDGLGMLLHQAAPGFAAWFGVEPEVTEELRRTVAAGLVA
jgi:shikimate dehydrogenase